MRKDECVIINQIVSKIKSGAIENSRLAVENYIHSFHSSNFVVWKANKFGSVSDKLTQRRIKDATLIILSKVQEEEVA